MLFVLLPALRVQVRNTQISFHACSCDALPRYSWEISCTSMGLPFGGWPLTLTDTMNGIADNSPRFTAREIAANIDGPLDGAALDATPFEMLHKCFLAFH